MPVVNFGITEILTFLLVFARTAGIFTSAPIFGNMHVNVFSRVGLAFFLALIFLPLAKLPQGGIPLDLLTLTGFIVKEAAVGLIIGFVGMLMFMVVQMAGEMIDLQTGFGMAQMIDPTMNNQSALISQLHTIAATLLFLFMNAHHLVIRGLADSFYVIPLGGLALSRMASISVLGLFTQFFLIALKIGGPVVGVVLLTDVALGILSRAVPQLNILVLGLPVKIIVGLAAVALAMPMAFAVIGNLFGGLHQDILLLAKQLR